MKLPIKIIAGLVSLGGLFMYLLFIDVYEYPPERFKSGNVLITQSDYYLMKNADSFVVNGKMATAKTFSDSTEYTIYLNGKVHLQGAFFSWIYYIWELLLFTILFILWYIYEQGKFSKLIPLFCATLWLIRAVWQLLLLFNFVGSEKINTICKAAAILMLWMAFFSIAVTKIKSEHETVNK